ncbi:MAG: hypothetical protein KF705_13245 [Phycisphaeraceae bacterium]|nr:hypothetical protein [Phycisphaeraceae bacterium]
MQILKPLLGIAMLAAIAWALSSDRRRFPWRLAAIGFTIQIVIAGAFLSFPPLVTPSITPAGSSRVRSARPTTALSFSSDLNFRTGGWTVGVYLRDQGSACDHLLRGIDGRALSHRSYAADRQRHGVAAAPHARRLRL